MAEAAENGGQSGDRSSQGSEACDCLGGTIIIRSDKTMKELAKWLYESTEVMGCFSEEYHDLKFYKYHSLKDLEIALNSGIQCEKTHELRARCTVFFTKVNKDLLVKIKTDIQNETLRKKAQEDSGITIDDIRHIGRGRTIRVHCRTPTGANTIIKNGLIIGGITLRKGKLEEIKPVIQCTYCWKLDHKNMICELSLSKELPICGTCGKAGHRRKTCPTPNDPKCVLCDGKHSSSSAKCLVRQAKIEEVFQFQKDLSNISIPPQQSVSVQVGDPVDLAIQQCAGMITQFVSRINDTDSAVEKAIQANVRATIALATPSEAETDVGDVVHAAIAATIRPKYDSYETVKKIGDTAWRRAKGSKGMFIELYKEYLIQNDMPVPNFPDFLLDD